MKVQFFCDNTLISTFQGNRDETGAILKDMVRTLGLSLEDDFELQNRLTVLFKEEGPHDLFYQTQHFRFRLHAPDQSEKAKATGV